MYNHTSISEFIHKISKEAEKAAQDIFDKHNAELERRVKAQIKTGDKFVIGMGTAFIMNSKGEYVGEKLGDVLSRTAYCEDVTAGFNLNDIQK
jgi:hypothetical protein